MCSQIVNGLQQALFILFYFWFWGKIWFGPVLKIQPLKLKHQTEKKDIILFLLFSIIFIIHI